MPGQYILEGREPVACADVIAWARWFEGADRQVADSFRDDVRVSTVFLGLDHNFWGYGPPVLFETMVFMGETSIQCERYATWDQAEEGHKRWVMKAFPPTPVLTIPQQGTDE